MNNLNKAEYVRLVTTLTLLGYTADKFGDYEMQNYVPFSFELLNL